MFTQVLSIRVTILIPEIHFEYPGHQLISALSSLCVCEIPMAQVIDRLCYTRISKVHCPNDRRPSALVPGISSPSLHGTSTKAGGQCD